MLDALLLISGLMLTVLGIIGCIVPVLPGPPLSYFSLLCIQFSSLNGYSAKFLWIFGILTLVITIADYLLPVLGTKMAGATKYGIYGSFIGMLIGILWFPPVGMIIGLITGAIAGELIAGKERSDALKAGIVSFLSSLLMIITKFSLSVVMSYYFLKSAINWFLS